MLYKKLINNTVYREVFTPGFFSPFRSRCQWASLRLGELKFLIFSYLSTVLVLPQNKMILPL